MDERCSPACCVSIRCRCLPVVCCVNAGMGLTALHSRSRCCAIPLDLSPEPRHMGGTAWGFQPSQVGWPGSGRALPASRTPASLPACPSALAMGGTLKHLLTLLRALLHWFLRPWMLKPPPPPPALKQADKGNGARSSVNSAGCVPKNCFIYKQAKSLEGK